MARNNRELVTPNRLDRRTFLATGVASGVLAANVPVAVGASGNDDAPTESSHAPSPELIDVTISDLRQGLESGEFTSRGLVEKYLARINALDRDGPQLRSVIESNPDAIDIADQLDQERRSKGPRGPLHGIPVLIKDNIDTADRMATTAGSLALVGARPPEDAFVVKQLRNAGAIIIGKTNLSEWANIRSKNSTSGWSGRGGLTRNPYVLDRNPSGSSSGSAAAVSAGLCAVAVGTETDGSILCPASACGIVGIKPTVGLVSRTGIVPISHSQDTAGPMARTVRDAAIFLGILAGVDEQDAITRESTDHTQTDYTKFLNASGLQGARLGVARNYFGLHEEVDSLMNTALDAMKSAGATLIDTDLLSVVSQAGPAKGTVFKYELKADMATYLSRLGADAPVKTLKDIIEFNDRNKDKELLYFGQDFFLAAEAKGPLTEPEYEEALSKCRRLTRTEGIDAVVEKLNVDALIAPTTGPAWVSDLVCGDNWLGSSTSAAAIAGYPSVTVPAGSILGLPVGISFFGRAWSEPTLLKIAYSFEQATKFRRPPQFRATLNHV